MLGCTRFPSRTARLHAVEFDSVGAIDVWFVPLRAGAYPFQVEGLEADGFRGTFIVE